jgi:hypothetical protein
MKEMTGVQDVFCGPQTVVHLKRGSNALPPRAVEEMLERFEVACDGVQRDDSAML